MSIPPQELNNTPIPNPLQLLPDSNLPSNSRNPTQLKFPTLIENFSPTSNTLIRRLSSVTTTTQPFHPAKSKISLRDSHMKHCPEKRELLNSARVTMTHHKWNTLDTRDAGWILFSHPRFHNRDHMKTYLQNALRLQTEKNDLPTFHLYSKQIIHGKPTDTNKISTQAIHIECESTRLNELRELLFKLYSTKDQKLPGKFIPTNFQHIQKENKYAQILQQQIRYLDDHRNISILGVSIDDLKIYKHPDCSTKTILSSLIETPGITWISPNHTISTTDQKQLNISTDKTHYYNICSTIKTLVLDNIDHSSSNIINHATTTKSSPQPPSHAAKTYLDALCCTTTNAEITDPPTTTITNPTNTDISSLSPSTTQIKLSNIQEHVSRSIKLIRKEFKTFQQSLREEIKNQVTSALEVLTKTSASSYSNYNNPKPSIQKDLHESLTSVKDDLKMFRAMVKNELHEQLQKTIIDTIHTTKHQLTTMITKEVNRALKDHMKLQSPRHRKTKRSRIRDGSDSDFYKQLFTDSAKPTSNNQPSDDDLSITKEFDKANEIPRLCTSYQRL